MIKNLRIILITVSMFFLGMLLFLYQKELIVFRFPKINLRNKISNLPENSKIKKNIKLFYWINDKWNIEKVEVIWSNNNLENIRQIVSAWLNLLDEEKIIDKRISLQSVLLNNDGQEIFLSFDRSLFNEESSTHDKLLLIESLLKTLREVDLKIKKIKFLIHNQEITDSHLNFLQSWPIEGFIN